MKSSHSKCSICGGSGVITKVIDGNLFAKNCQCIEKEIIERKSIFANIPIEFRSIKVSDFKTTLYVENEAREIAKAAREVAKNYIINFDKYKSLGKGLYFYSNTKGSGKTMLALAIGNALISTKNEIVKFATMVDILEEIKNSYNNKDRDSSLIDDLMKVPVFIIDDIGTERLTGWSNEVIYKIMNSRMNNKQVTIFTSNVHISKLKHDERIISRIDKMSLSVQMPEESIRQQLTSKENIQIMKELLGVEND